MIKENYNLAFKRQLHKLRPISSSDIAEILETCEKNPRLHLVRDIVRILANTGLRNSELASLRISQVDIIGRWVTIVEGRKAPAIRKIPLGPKTIVAIASLHSMNPESPFVLGEFPNRRMRIVIARLRSMWPRLTHDRLLLHRVRINFACRLMCAGIPIGVVSYCLGCRDISRLFGRLALSPDERLDIVRRNLERFVDEL
jgi:integrase